MHWLEGVGVQHHGVTSFPGCILETVKCRRKLILGLVIGWGV